MTTTIKTPEQIADDVLKIDSGTAHELNARYRAEHEMLAEVVRTSRKELEAELVAARADLEAYRANVGPIDGLVTKSRYARIGEHTCALVGSQDDWDCDDIVQDIAETWARIDSNPLSDQTPEQLAHWRKIADSLGIEHDGEEDEELETCTEDDCDESLDDGEGYDGYCGTHADQREAAGVYDGEDVPA